MTKITWAELEVMVASARAKVNARTISGEISPAALKDVNNLIELMGGIMMILYNTLSDKRKENPYE